MIISKPLCFPRNLSYSKNPKPLQLTTRHSTSFVRETERRLTDCATPIVKPSYAITDEPQSKSPTFSFPHPLTHPPTTDPHTRRLSTEYIKRYQLQRKSPDLPSTTLASFSTITIQARRAPVYIQLDGSLRAHALSPSSSAQSLLLRNHDGGPTSKARRKVLQSPSTITTTLFALPHSNHLLQHLPYKPASSLLPPAAAATTIPNKHASPCLHLATDSLARNLFDSKQRQCSPPATTAFQ